jgi:raffinose/stachyose/melibiose transport system permease protein
MGKRPRPERKPGQKDGAWKYIVSLFIILIYILPIYVLVNMAFKQPTDLGSRLALPAYLDFSNFTKAFEGGKILKALCNTMLIAAGTVAIETVFGCMAAYAFARNHSRFNRFMQAFSLGVMMIPPLSILVGVYTEIVSLNGINHAWAVIAITSAFGLPMSIHLYTNFIQSIPVALDEASAIDGASVLQTFWRIILPQLKPVTVSVVILKGVGAWNDYLYPYYILQKPSNYTLVLLINQYFGSADSAQNMHGAAAVAVLCVLPLIVIYLVLQKYFIQGQIDSSVK